jgi:hypothetical protein
VLPGNSFHLAAVEPDLGVPHALAFMQEASGNAATPAPLPKAKE